MLIVRAGGIGRSGGNATAASSTGKNPSVMQSAPPPACRQSPVSAGIAVIARIAAPPPPCRCRPSPSRIAVGRVDAIRSPSPRTADDSSPHTSAARSTGHSASRSSSSGQPTVYRAEPLTILRPGVEDGAHQAERQRGVRSRQRCDVLVRAFGGRRPDRVDDHDVSALLSGLEDEPPLVDVRRQGARTPAGSRAVPARDPPGRSRRLRSSPRARPGPRRRRSSCRAATRRAPRRASGPSSNPGSFPSCPRSRTAAPTRARVSRRRRSRPSAASAIASSQPMRSNRPDPFSPTRLSG